MQLEINAQQGWICPKCGKVHAPWVPSCECSSKNETLTINPKGTGVDMTDVPKFDEANTTTTQMICS